MSLKKVVVSLFVSLLLLKFKTSVTSQFRNTDYFPWAVRSRIKSWLRRCCPLVDKKIFRLQYFSVPFQIWSGFREEHAFKKAGSSSGGEQSRLVGRTGWGGRCLRDGWGPVLLGCESRRSQGARACDCYGNYLLMLWNCPSNKTIGRFQYW